MRHSLQSRLSSVVVAAFALVTMAACSQSAPAEDGLGRYGGGGSSGGGGGGSSGGGSGGGGTVGGSSGAPGGSGSGGGSGGGGVTPSDGGIGVTTTVDGGPPASEPPQANGFQQTIAPLLDAQGCTECHHHGRQIDLTTYPFMAGTAAATAQQLVASFTKDMPPAPRTAAAQTVIDQVNAWVAAGMKP